MSPLEALIQQLQAQAGSRGSTFAGRVIPQGQPMTLDQILGMLPIEPVGGEGGGALLASTGAIGARKLLPPPKNKVKISEKGKGFAEQKFPYELDVNVQFPNDTFLDTVKGLNRGHAAARAVANWPDAAIEFLGGKITKNEIVQVLEKILATQPK